MHMLGRIIGKDGALGGIRTHDPCLRRAILYPAELQAHCFCAPMHSFECTRLAGLLGASPSPRPFGTVLSDVVHLRSPNPRPLTTSVRYFSLYATFGLKSSNNFFKATCTFHKIIIK